MSRLEKELRKVQSSIQKNIRTPKGKLGEAIRYTFSKPGKQLRPSFVLLFGNMGDEPKKERLINIAGSVEILHNATLIHDDIIDNSSVRRGSQSVQAKYGKTIALYAGDYLFALSLQLLSENTSKITNLRVNGSTMQKILAGETTQFGNEYDTAISEKEYLEQIRGKTASLFGYSCYIGALEGGLNKRLARSAQQVGVLFGQAFQLRDDILDYTASTAELKKPVLSDVVNGVYTGPLIFALKKDPTGKLNKLVEKGKDISSSELAQIEYLVNELGGIRHAQKLANDFTSSALALLKDKFSNYSGYDEVVEIVQKMLTRNY